MAGFMVPPGKGSGPRRDTERLLRMTAARQDHPLFARMYARLSRRMEAQGVGDHRRRLLAGLTGQVIEVGAGNGLNFRHYPEAVSRVLAVEPEPYLREQALRNARRATVAVEVVDGDASSLPAEDATFDAAVCSLVLCSVPDPRSALAEIRRVLTAQGQLRFYEHVRSASPRLAKVQQLMDATFWPKVAAGCHASRDTLSCIRAAGFRVEALEEFRFPDSRLVPVAPHAIGVAHVGPTGA